MSDSTETKILKLGFMFDDGETFNEVSRKEIEVEDTGELDPETGTRVLVVRSSDGFDLLLSAIREEWPEIRRVADFYSDNHEAITRAFDKGREK